MNTRQAIKSMKPVVTGVIVGGLSLASLSMAGCERLSASQIAELMSTSIVDTAYQIVAAQKPEPSYKIANNHNETFLCGGSA